VELEVGVIVVATGSQEIDAKGLYGYGTDARIITQLELEEMLAEYRMQNAEIKGRIILNSEF